MRRLDYPIIIEKGTTGERELKMLDGIVSSSEFQVSTNTLCLRLDTHPSAEFWLRGPYRVDAREEVRVFYDDHGSVNEHYVALALEVFEGRAKDRVKYRINNLPK